MPRIDGLARIFWVGCPQPNWTYIEPLVPHGLWPIFLSFGELSDPLPSFLHCPHVKLTICSEEHGGLCAYGVFWGSWDSASIPKGRLDKWIISTLLLSIFHVELHEIGSQCGADMLILSDSNCFHKLGPGKKCCSHAPPLTHGAVLEKTSGAKEEWMGNWQKEGGKSTKALRETKKPN